jgi:ATP-dependent helicase HrpB
MRALGLPIEEAIPRLRAAFRGANRVVLQAPPGAGKTTIVPLALLDEPWLAGRSILMLEPRRLAARAACARMAELCGEEIGKTIGYRIRFESRVSRATRVEVVTEGILTRRLQSDSALEGVGLVIFDEFHERHLQTDLSLALTLDAQEGLREDLKVLVMSATLDGAAVSKLLGDAPIGSRRGPRDTDVAVADSPIVTSEGRLFPVETRYLGAATELELPDRMRDAIARALADTDGDVLAFLPGAGEIRRTQERLAARASGDVEVFPLYGDLPWEQQTRVFARMPAGKRRVILATPIAETSLTLEGVRAVVDSGYVRLPQFQPGSGLTRLVTQRISKASAEQRAGRAGRLAPGICYRLWSDSIQHGLVPQTPPEIRGADLAPLALELALWGARDASKLKWLDPPPPAAMAQARELLQELDALDAEGRITDMGRAMAKLPVHPRLAHMLLRARDRGEGALASDLAALISERDILRGESARSSDVGDRIETLYRMRSGNRGGNVDAAACDRVERVAREFRRLIGTENNRTGPAAEDAGLLLALAYPDRVALQRAPNDARYLLANGRGARLPEGEQRLRKPMLVAATLDAGETEGRIFLAAELSIENFRKEFAQHIESRDVMRWDDATAAVVARREERYGALVLGTSTSRETDPDAVRAAMLEGVRRLGLNALPWSDAANDLRARIGSMRAWFPDEGWPDLTDAALIETLDRWLGPHLYGISRRDHLARLDLVAVIEGMLDHAQKRQLDKDAPTHVTVPSGSRIRLDYRPGESPALAVKLQEMFGLADTPRVARGRVPITLRLLSPARRPIQVTQDLKGFWERTYAEVKRELKGRYPKHPWPDDPWNAVPTARAKRRG